MKMRLVVILLLLCSGPFGFAAETPAQRGDREARVREFAKREADRAAELARSMNGLQITSFMYLANGWAQVVVQNITDSPVTFDYHKVRGIELETGNVTHVGNVKFPVEAIASYEVSARARRNFQVFFFGGRQIAAIGWADRDGWRVNSQSTAPTVEAAITAARKIQADERAADRKRKLKPVKDGVVRN